MNGLALDITILSFLILFLSVWALLIGFMWQHKDCEISKNKKAQQAQQAQQDQPDKKIWNGESFNDPRDVFSDAP